MDVQTVRRWIQAGKLRAFKPGKEYRVREADLEEFLAAREVRPKGLRRSSLEPSFNDVLADERRGPKLPEVADLLLGFGETLLLTWEAELPERARADDVEWLANIAVLWRGFGLVNYGVLEELGAEGVRDKQGWLARYMDINAAVHRINAAIREHSAAGASPDEEAAVTLAPLAAETA